MPLSELDSYEIEKSKKELSMSLQDYYHAAKEFEQSNVKKSETPTSLLTCDQAKKMIQNRVDECVANICNEIMKAIVAGSRSIDYPADQAYDMTMYIRKVIERLEELGYTVNYHPSNNSINVRGWI